MQWFNWPIVAAVVVLVIVVWGIRYRRNAALDGATMAYELGECLLTDDQIHFLEVLEQAVGADHRVLLRVPLADVITVDDSLHGRALETALARLHGRQFNFLVCTQAALEPVCAVELDEPSPRRTKLPRRDLQLDAICEQAGLPLLRIASQLSYQVADIGLQFDALFEPPVSTRDAWEPELDSLMSGLSLSARPDSMATDALGDAGAAAMECPRCAAPMVLQRAPRGATPDKAFWACSLAPSCRQRMPLQRERSQEPLSQRLEGLVP
ncbi:DUF2726 domain-containing protein [Marinobacterium rhizophilum]|uniref:DUF2726 domain-containing protein n=1 Tax=Marinobacterium rhizophilum TaxID=420402 RepID=A0ABY5HK58_9GAMM|nr:DUF2726 domain-containing protein [Marinobacterium rhizophilum]UTW11630.1 DUF2726 domain-containing protein [Marinobacterium rhizophilum]